MNNTTNYVAMGNNEILKNKISTTRKTIEYGAKVNTGKCAICDFIHSIGRTTRGTGKGKNRIETPSHVRGLHICDYHMNVRNNLFGYNFEYNKASGKPTAKRISQSIEFETEQCNINGIVNMECEYSSIASEDGSLDDRNGVEFKSVVYVSNHGMSKMLGGIQDCIEKGYFKVTENCGTHLHTSIYKRLNADGFPVSEFNYTELAPKEIYRPLFFPTCKYFNVLGMAKRIEYFGSDFRYYAKNPVEYERELYDGHAFIFNVQHTYSLEFRLPRFTSAEQYRKIAAYMQEVVTNIAEFQRGEKSAPIVGHELLEIAKRYFPR